MLLMCIRKDSSQHAVALQIPIVWDACLCESLMRLLVDGRGVAGPSCCTSSGL